MDLNTPSRFRLWVQRFWMENCEERLTYGDKPATIKQYWHTYKWWIKREYQHQERENVRRQTTTAL